MNAPSEIISTHCEVVHFLNVLVWSRKEVEKKTWEIHTQSQFTQS